MIENWPCQQLHGGWPPYIYTVDENGMCKHEECNPECKAFTVEEKKHEGKN